MMHEGRQPETCGRELGGEHVRLCVDMDCAPIRAPPMPTPSPPLLADFT